MRPALRGYPIAMGDREHTQQPVEEQRPVEVDGAPAEEDLSGADVAERVDLDPDEQLNRPDQPDASPEERRQYEHPTGPPIAETGR
jgi:hypothetical protein